MSSHRRVKSRPARGHIPPIVDPNQVNLTRGPAQEHADDKVIVSFEYEDFAYVGSWGPPSGDEWPRLIVFLREVCGCTWSQVHSQRRGQVMAHLHHFQHVSTVCDEAQRRLSQLGLEDVLPEDLFRFGVSGRGRLWGWVAGPIFNVLWWDAKHAVYPLA